MALDKGQQRQNPSQKVKKKKWCKAVKGRKEAMGKREERPKQKGV